MSLPPKIMLLSPDHLAVHLPHNYREIEKDKNFKSREERFNFWKQWNKEKEEREQKS